MSAPALGARCGMHAEVPAVALCQRCGRFVCGGCMDLVGEDPYCEGCFALTVRRPPSARSQAAAALGGTFVTLGLYGLMLGWILNFGWARWLAAPGLAAWLMARAELRAIERGDSPRSSHIYARAGLIFGWVAVGELFLGLALAAWGWRK